MLPPFSPEPLESEDVFLLLFLIPEVPRIGWMDSTTKARGLVVVFAFGLQPISAARVRRPIVHRSSKFRSRVFSHFSPSFGVFDFAREPGNTGEAQAIPVMGSSGLLTALCFFLARPSR